MEDFYKKLEAFKADNGLSYSKLGATIDKTGDAMRMAVSRRSLTKLEQKSIEKLFVGGEQKENPPVSMEDLLAAKIMDRLLPIINKVLDSHQKIIKELLQQGLEIDELLDEVQELKEISETILKEVRQPH